MTYYWLSTIRLDADSPTLRLAESIRLNQRYEDVQLPTEMYVTNVYRCTRIGNICGNPLYERQYENLVEAQQGHRETLEALAAGRLKF
jgi:hypothetical protein